MMFASTCTALVVSLNMACALISLAGLPTGLGLAYRPEPGTSR